MAVSLDQLDKEMTYKIELLNPDNRVNILTFEFIFFGFVVPKSILFLDHYIIADC